MSGNGLCWAETETTNEYGTWRYLIAINTSAEPTLISDHFDIGDEFVVYDWRAETAAPTRIRRAGDVVEVITEGGEPERTALWWIN